MKIIADACKAIAEHIEGEETGYRDAFACAFPLYDPSNPSDMIWGSIIAGGIVLSLKEFFVPTGSLADISDWLGRVRGETLREVLLEIADVQDALAFCYVRIRETQKGEHQ